MNSNLTEIVIVSDRSGSMGTCRAEAQGGINAFIEEQKAAPGEARLTFVEFDDRYDVIHDGKPIKEVVAYELVPRGWTALLDAIGKAVTTVGERLAKLAEDDRPGLVVVVISTDGHENKSTEYTAAQIKEMIRVQTETYAWKFMFLGANIDAIKTAGDLAIPTSGAINVAVDKIGAGYRASSSKVHAMRSATMRGASAVEMDSLSEYTDAERSALK